MTTAPLSDRATKLARLAFHSAEPFTPDHPYFAQAEPHMAYSWSNVIALFLAPYRRYDTVLDLACGHGRNSVLLRAIADRLILMDIQPGNIDVCRQRIKGAGNISYVVNDGFGFTNVADASVSLIYCFDAMVHFDSDVVRSCLSDLKRILEPQGLAVLHHSNYVGGEDWRIGPANRSFYVQRIDGSLRRQGRPAGGKAAGNPVVRHRRPRLPVAVEPGVESDRPSRHAFPRSHHRHAQRSPILPAFWPPSKSSPACRCTGSFGSPADSGIEGLLSVFGEMLESFDRLFP